MIYAYIFVMAGVTYLIRMLPEKNKEPDAEFIFILYSLRMSYRHDFSGNSLCYRITFLRICRACGSRISGSEKEKPDFCGRLCLCRSISCGENPGDVVKSDKW